MAASGWLRMVGCEWLETSGWRPAAGDQRLATRGWRPAAGDQWLATSGWRQMAGRQVAGDTCLATSGWRQVAGNKYRGVCVRLPLCMQRPCVSTAFAYIGAVSHTPHTYGKQKKIRIFLDFSCFATVAFQWFAKYRKSLGNWIRTEMLKLQFCQNVEIYDNLVFCYFGTCPCGLRDAQLMALYAQLFFSN